MVIGTPTLVLFDVVANKESVHFMYFLRQPAGRHGAVEDNIRERLETGDELPGVLIRDAAYVGLTVLIASPAFEVNGRVFPHDLQEGGPVDIIAKQVTRKADPDRRPRDDIGRRKEIVPDGIAGRQEIEPDAVIDKMGRQA